MSIFQLKITLNDTKTYRTMLVNSQVTFDDLHQYIQKLFNFDDYHLYSFETFLLVDTLTRAGKPKKVTRPNFIIAKKQGDTQWDENTDFYAETCKIEEHLQKPLDKILYIYDFGDSWEFDVVLQKISEEEVVDLPKCVETKGLCCLEDIGGIWGYSEYQEILKTDKLDSLQKEHFGYLKENLELGVRTTKIKVLATWEALGTLEYINKQLKK